MEIIIGLIVIGAIGYFIVFRKKNESLTPAAPYKVEETVVPTTVAEPVVETAPVVESTPAPAVVEEAPVIVDEIPATKPRKPRAPMAVPAAAEKKPVAKKPAAKKPAAKKPVAITAKSKSKKA